MRAYTLIGGGSGYALTLLGVEYDDPETERCGGSAPPLFLLLDPHYTGRDELEAIMGEGRWVAWRSASDAFSASSFFNLCMPLLSEASVAAVTSTDPAPTIAATEEVDWAAMMSVQD